MLQVHDFGFQALLLFTFFFPPLLDDSLNNKSSSIHLEEKFQRGTKISVEYSEDVFKTREVGKAERKRDIKFQSSNWDIDWNAVAERLAQARLAATQLEELVPRWGISEDFEGKSATGTEGVPAMNPAGKKETTKMTICQRSPKNPRKNRNT